MKTILFWVISLTISFLACIDLSGQVLKKGFEFEQLNSEKSVYLKKGRDIMIVEKMVKSLIDTNEINNHAEMKINPSMQFQENRTEYYGKLIELTDSFLIISCDLQTLNLTFQKDSSIRIEKSYENRPIIKKIRKADIEMIDYDGKASNFFAAGMITSFLSLIVGAPLLAYNYSNGTFNGNLYLDIVKYSGLAILIIEIPYFITTSKACKIKLKQ